MLLSVSSHGHSAACVASSYKDTFPSGSDAKESACNVGVPGFNPWVRKIVWRREWQLTPAVLPGKFHGQKNLVSYSPWSCKELDMTQQLTLLLHCCKDTSSGNQGFNMRILRTYSSTPSSVFLIVSRMLIFLKMFPS